MPGAARLSRLLCPAADLDAAVAFYQRAFGLRLSFQDGQRYAEFARAEVALALVAEGEAVAGGRPALSVRVEDVEDALDAVRAAGGTVLSAAQTGPHEVRAVIADPAGNAVVVYRSLPQPGGG